MQMHTGPLSGLSDEEEDEADADDETSQERMELGDRMEQWMETGPAGTGCCIHQAPTSLPGLPCLLCFAAYHSHRGVESVPDQIGGRNKQLSVHYSGMSYFYLHVSIDGDFPISPIC